MKIITCDQGSPEWFAARAGKATASKFDAITTKPTTKGEALTRRDYRVDLVVERLTGKATDYFQSGDMKTGTEREPLARAAYEVATGRVVQEVGFCLHDALEAGASPDGLLGDDGLIEIKCGKRATHLEYMKLAAGEAPSRYRAQIQGQLWITGREFCDFVSFNPDWPEERQLVIRRIKRDEPYITGLALAVSLFMDEVRAEVEAVLRLPLAA